MLRRPVLTFTCIVLSALFCRARAADPDVPQLNPKTATPEAYNDRGNLCLEKKEIDKAIADYNEAIRRAPKSAYLYANRSNAYLEKKEYDRAITDLNEAIRLEPKKAEWYQRSGQRLREQEELRAGHY